MASHFDPEIPGAAMYREPSFMRLLILTVFNEVVASAERADTFIKDGLLQLYSSAEIRNEAGIYARCFVDQFGSG